MNDHECDDDCSPGLPAESLQVLDIIGLCISTAGGVLIAFGNGLGAIGREFFSAARRRRQIEENIRARAEAGFELERLLDSTLGDER